MPLHQHSRQRARIAALSIAALPMLLSACSPAGNPENGAVPETAPQTVAPTPDASPDAAAASLSRTEKSDLIDFSYTAPALSVPEVSVMLSQRADAAKTAALAGARQNQQAAEKGGFPYRTQVYHADWAVAADTPRLLSLVATVGTYTGGAHGMTVFEPLLWDKRARKTIDAAALFTGTDAMEAALRKPFCDALDRERAKKRGAPVARSDDPFSQCIDPAKEVIVPTASGAGGIDSFTVYVAPYDAGPYAEGAYQVTVPVDAALLKAIEPAYRDAFGSG
jgi:hypothetical protein